MHNKETLASLSVTSKDHPRLNSSYHFFEFHLLEHLVHILEKKFKHESRRHIPTTATYQATMIHANMETLVSIRRFFEKKRKEKTIDNATREIFKRAKISGQVIIK